jgi:Asp-tRNA(Asn)/Glu-tRNA(Gln) amidotransferase A subunit family amidase
MEQMHDLMANLDVLVTPSFEGGVLGITNLTGHPCVCIPNALRPVDEGPDSRRQPGSISLIGPLYGDAAPLALAHTIQQETDFHTRRPPIE